MIEIQYVWEHWKFNADQRIKAFNYFVVFAIFADGGLFAAIDKGAHPVVFATIGFLIIALAAAFWVIDVRSERLIRLSEPGLLAFESSLSKSARIFHADAPNRRSPIRYKNSFRALFVIQILLGFAVLIFGTLSSLGVLSRNTFAPVSMQEAFPGQGLKERLLQHPIAPDVSDSGRRIGRERGSLRPCLAPSEGGFQPRPVVTVMPG